jgi:hypothetical protein
VGLIGKTKCRRPRCDANVSLRQVLSLNGKHLPHHPRPRARVLRLPLTSPQSPSMTPQPLMRQTHNSPFVLSRSCFPRRRIAKTSLLQHPRRQVIARRNLIITSHDHQMHLSSSGPPSSSLSMYPPMLRLTIAHYQRSSA